MSINVKKYTKDQMAKMVEDAQEKTAALEAEIIELKNCIDEKNDLIAEYANLKADADTLRNKLTDTDAALRRANACIATMQVEKDQQTKDCFEWQRSAQDLHDDLLNARERAHYAESHPWRNLWSWLERKLVRHE